MAEYEVIIVGAGVTGLCAAHTFLSIDPSLSLLVVDDKKSIGGVWASEQLYPGLRTNHSQGYYEFADLPLLDLDLNVQPRGVVPGETQNAYLNEFAKRFGLMKHIQLRSKVVRAVESDAGGWDLDVSVDDGKKNDRIKARKLVVATGTYSSPNDLKFKGMETFGRPIVHSVDLGRNTAAQLKDESIKNVTVLGGSRSAYESVNTYATAGKSVTWLMRTPAKGRGAMPIAPSYTPLGPFKVWAEGLLMCRHVSWFCAAPWSEGDGFGWIRSFLHGTWIGNRMVEALFWKIQDDATRNLKLRDDETTAALVPDASTLWYGTQISSVNYDNSFYDLIRNGTVKVMRGDIERLGPSSVHLEDGRTIECDALVCATGWNYSASVPLEPADRRPRWGCPVKPAQDEIHTALDEKADRELFERFPLLKRSPARPEREPVGLTPWRLWRFIAPPSQVPLSSGGRNIAFLNGSVSYQATTKAEITSLWAYAYLCDKLEVASPSEEEARYEACLWTRFGKWSVPYGMQGKVADFLFNSMPYYDLLMRDLGLNSWRKGWGWFGEVFGSWYDIKDYKGIIDEWKAKQNIKS